ncbi:MAG TPA: SGNH/GDSL hydrolase family protein [Croceibacterium sp.]|nr:SGNH/GDSL hydrolase family protein [Croceibacterium sp.]
MRFLLLLLALVLAAPLRAGGADGWTAAWATSQMVPVNDQVVPGEWLDDATLRQVVRVGLAGAQLRLRLSNVHGDGPLAIGGVTVARSVDNRTSSIDTSTLAIVTFGGEPVTTIPAGAEAWSDPIALPVRAGDDIAVSLYLPEAPTPPTGHPGSRATSYFAPANRIGAETLATDRTAPRWLVLAGVEVLAPEARAVVVLGDSITDGFGVEPDTNARWTDHLAARLRADPAYAEVAVLNAGIGGNRLLLDGLGPNALARFERDVLSQPGVTHLIVLEGVNDLGTLTRDGPATAEQHAALVAQATEALRQIVLRARARGIKVIGGTIMPFGASAYYHPPAQTEADRQAINAWIRAPGHFDAVIDFDAAMRDPTGPARLAPTLDSGDGLHPSLDGYRAMAAAVPLELLR